MPIFIDPQPARYGILATQRQIREDLFEYDKYEDVLSYMASAMLKEARSEDADTLRILNKRKATRPLAFSKLLVLGQNGGTWDYKPKIRSKVSAIPILKNFGSLRAGTTFWSTPVRGDKNYLYFYDIWGNILFGYVAQASGFSLVESLFGSRIHDLFSGLDLTESGNDSLSIGVGAGLFDRVGYGLTSAELHISIYSTRLLWTRPPVRVTPKDLGYEANPIEV